MKPIEYNPSIKSSYMYLLFPLVIILGFLQAFVLKLPMMTVFMIYGIIPWLDQAISMDWVNPTLEQVVQLQKDQKFRFMLYLSIVLDWSSFIMGMTRVPTNSLYADILGAFLVMNLASTGFIIAHELFHKLNFLDKLVGTLHMAKNLYMHFVIEHLYGHHKNVATPGDPASADKGISVYEFVPKCIYGTYVSAFKHSPKFTIGSTLLSIAYLSVAYYFGGLKLGISVTIWAIGSIVYLETINYIQHYGLRRKRNPDGTYEKVTIRHSWNAPHRMSNYLFFKLQRHSDHHENSLKPYQTLASLEDSPMLPHGYLVCIMMAYFPSVWFSVMDPLVDEYAMSSIGTNLKALKVAQDKANSFAKTALTTTFTLMVAEIIVTKFAIGVVF